MSHVLERDALRPLLERMLQCDATRYVGAALPYDTYAPEVATPVRELPPPNPPG